MRAEIRFLAISSLACSGVLFAPASFAHTFGAEGAGFGSGFAHPFLGLDHLLAMIAVGLWATQLGGSALWRAPAVFVAAMAGGAALANPAVESPLVENLIAASVLALGLMVGFALRLPALWGILAVFAVSHGYSHGLEMPQATSPWGYGLGFMLATASLHLAGILLGISLARQKRLVRAGGMAIAAAGLLLLAA